MSTKIRTVATAVVTLPLDKPFQAGSWILSNVENAVVRITTDDGVQGIGYAFSFRRSHAALLAQAIQLLGDEVQGKDALAREMVEGELATAVNFLGTGGVMTAAMGALDMALWDIAGKVANLPVYRLLGGSSPRVPAYGSGGSHALSIPELQEEMGAMAAQGFGAVKMKLRGIREDVARVAAVRDVVGEEVGIMVDANQALTTKKALWLFRLLEPFHLYWFEEPVPHWQLKECQHIRQRIDVPLALGETLYGDRPFAEAAQMGAADVLMPNLIKVGGFTGWIRAQRYAKAAGIRISSHTVPNISAHAMAATPNRDLLEYMDWWNPLYAEPFQVHDGCIVIPDRPGLGLELAPGLMKD